MSVYKHINGYSLDKSTVLDALGTPANVLDITAGAITGRNANETAQDRLRAQIARGGNPIVVDELSDQRVRQTMSQLFQKSTFVTLNIDGKPAYIVTDLVDSGKCDLDYVEKAVESIRALDSFYDLSTNTRNQEKLPQERTGHQIEQEILQYCNEQQIQRLGLTGPKKDWTPDPEKEYLVLPLKENKLKTKAYIEKLKQGHRDFFSSNEIYFVTTPDTRMSFLIYERADDLLPDLAANLTMSEIINEVTLQKPEISRQEQVKEKEELEIEQAAIEPVNVGEFSHTRSFVRKVNDISVDLLGSTGLQEGMGRNPYSEFIAKAAPEIESYTKSEQLCASSAPLPKKWEAADRNVNKQYNSERVHAAQIGDVKQKAELDAELLEFRRTEDNLKMVFTNEYVGQSITSDLAESERVSDLEDHAYDEWVAKLGLDKDTKDVKLVEEPDSRDTKTKDDDMVL